ncbi:MAG TPA: radical SAM protein [Burkholderiales bacterium]|nr:radical SAM protein [Burkholderiales bacterium]
MTPSRSAAATALPAFVQIEPVGQCNLSCRMCPVVYRGEGARGRPPAFIRFETFCRILNEFPALTELQLQGMGEPFLHPRFLDMVRYAAARGIAVSTNTNLTALSHQRALECVASGLKTLHVSIDAADPGAYAYIRTGSSLSRVLRNLTRLMDAKRHLQSQDPDVILVAVAMRRNLEEMPQIVRLAHEYGIRSIAVQHLAHDFTEGTLPAQYQPMRNFVDAETLLHEDPERVERWFKEARTAAAELGVALRLPNVQPTPRHAARKGRERCDWPWRGAYVTYSGQAMPCCMIATPDRYSFGNMADNGVAAVWNSDDYEVFRERLASDEPPDICRGCAIYNGNF